MTKSNLLRVGAAALALAATAAVAGTGHQWGDFRWTSTNTQADLTLSYKFDTSTTTWTTYYNQALNEWRVGTSDGVPLKLTSAGQANHTTGAECEPIAGQILVCAANYGGNLGWVGIAEIDLLPGTNRFAWATAKFNDFYYNSNSPYAGTYNTVAQKEFVACHEIGHTFGLGHLDTAFYNPNKDSCMDYTADPDGGGKNPDNTDPGAIDWKVLNSTTMYGTLSGSTKGPKGGGRLDATGKADPFQFREVGALPPEPQGNAYGRYGRIAEYDDSGRPVTFVRDMPNGHTRVTYVTWAKDHRPEGSK